MKIFATLRNYFHFQGTSSLKGWNLAAVNCTTFQIYELPFQQTLIKIRHYILDKAETEGVRVYSVYTVYFKYVPLNTVNNGDANSTHVCVYMYINSYDKDGGFRQVTDLLSSQIGRPTNEPAVFNISTYNF